MRADLSLEFIFKGKDAEAGQLQFYDASQALVGLDELLA